MKFSVLLSIYHKEKPDYFDRCMQSIWGEQTVKPNEIVIVEDGRLTEELYICLGEWEKKIGSSLKRIVLKENKGLGKALNIGVKQCSYEFVARMDTDDISYPYRFEKQIQVLRNKDIDICSSWVNEFELDEHDITSCKKLPEHNLELIVYAKKRNPLNHPVVMYKKSIVQNAGGYKDMPGFEDYYLWVRMMKEGAKFYNIQEPLVNMRAGYGQIERRSGLKYAISELKFQKELLKLKFITLSEFIQNITIRFISRVLPKYLLKKIYSRIRT